MGAGRAGASSHPSLFPSPPLPPLFAAPLPPPPAPPPRILTRALPPAWVNMRALDTTVVARRTRPWTVDDRRLGSASLAFKAASMESEVFSGAPAALS